MTYKETSWLIVGSLTLPTIVRNGWQCVHIPSVWQDLDDDGKDEILYGSAAIDDDGSELWCTGNGHGDCLYVGRFIQNPQQINPLFRQTTDCSFF